MDAGIIEKFILQFDGDNRGAIKSIIKINEALHWLDNNLKKTGQSYKVFGEASGEVEDLSFKIGQHVGVQNKLTGQNEKTGLSIGALAAKFLGAYAAVNMAKRGYRLFMDQVGRTDTLGKLSITMGENIEQMYKWGQVTARNGGDVETFAQTVAGLNNNIAEIGISGNAAFVRTLALIGVTAQDAEGDVFKLFELIADKFQGMDKTRSMNLGRQLGLDQGTILTLQQGRRSLQDLFKEQEDLGGITAESAKYAALLNDEKSNLSQIFDVFLSKFNGVGAALYNATGTLISNPKAFFNPQLIPFEGQKYNEEFLRSMGVGAVDYMSPLYANPLNSMHSGTTTNSATTSTSNRSVSIGAININGASDPKETAKEAVRQIEDQFKAGKETYSDGQAL